MNLTLLRPRLHLIGLAGIALINTLDGLDAWRRRHDIRRRAEYAQTMQDLDEQNRKMRTMPVATNDGVVDRAAWDANFERAECACPSERLEADIMQSGENAWVWRIYDLGCNEVQRKFAEGGSDSLDEAYADVQDVMEHLCEMGNYALGDPEFHVFHHVCAELEDQS